jgi:hypothetical protein
VRRLLIGFALSILVASSARAIQAPSPYFLSHPKWRCEEMLREYRRIPQLALPIILDTPGKDYSCLDRVLQLPNLVAVELHVINETCFPERGRRCQKHEVPYGYSVKSWTEKIRKRDSGLVRRIQGAAARAAAIAAKARPSVQVFVSPLLESNLGTAEGKIVIDIFRPYFTRPVTFVWNPVRDVGRIEGTHYELHGYNPRLSAPCIYNNDGAFYEPVQAPYYLGKYSQCAIAAYWTLGDNCNDKRYSKTDGFVEVPKRVGCNRAREFRQIVDNIIKVTGPAPSANANPSDLRGCRAIRKVPDGEKRGFIWKQMEPAEGGRSCGGRPSNGAVVLVPFGDSSKKLEAWKDGKRVESFCFAGDYAHDQRGRQRKLYRTNRNVPDFPAGTVLKTDKNICFVVKNPAERID